MYPGTGWSVILTKVPSLYMFHSMFPRYGIDHRNEVQRSVSGPVTAQVMAGQTGPERAHLVASI